MAARGHQDRSRGPAFTAIAFVSFVVDLFLEPKRKKPGLSAGLPLSSAKSPVIEIRS